MLKKCLLSILGGIICTILFYFLPCIYFYGYNDALWNKVTYDFQPIGLMVAIFAFSIFIFIDIVEDGKKNNEVINIDSRGEYPANVLSNLHECPFYFDGVYCASREGLLQAFKTQFVNEQVRLCGLSGREAQKSGQQYNNWKDDQFLYWKGKSFERGSQEYQELLKGVFDPENMSLDVIIALLSTDNKKLVHTIGKSDVADTVLTEQEFCALMMNARDILREKGLRYLK